MKMQKIQRSYQEFIDHNKPSLAKVISSWITKCFSKKADLKTLALEEARKTLLQLSSIQSKDDYYTFIVDANHGLIKKIVSANEVDLLKTIHIKTIITIIKTFDFTILQLQSIASIAWKHTIKEIAYPVILHLSKQNDEWGLEHYIKAFLIEAYIVKEENELPLFSHKTAKQYIINLIEKTQNTINKASSQKLDEYKKLAKQYNNWLDSTEYLGLGPPIKEEKIKVFS